MPRPQENQKPKSTKLRDHGGSMSPEDERLDIGDASAEHPVAIPSELPILPLRDTVLFPNSFLPLAVARESSVRLIEEAISGSKLVGVFTQRDASIEEPAQDDLR